MPASDFVGIMSHIGFVGDPLVHTQHHLGASKWRKISNEEAVGYHQLRVCASIFFCYVSMCFFDFGYSHERHISYEGYLYIRFLRVFSPLRKIRAWLSCRTFSHSKGDYILAKAASLTNTFSE